MPKFKIFYSWQSDLPGNKTRSFIRECIDDAIDLAQESEAIEAERDEATKDTTGSPNIVTTLFSKIDDCDLFVADLSLCYTEDSKKKKRSSNPNVLLELGYAVKILGWERIICLCNKDFGEEYPFDIAHNRITSFSFEGKTRNEVKNEISRIIFINIRDLRKLPPRAKNGMATFVVGSYDSKKKKVVPALRPVELQCRESFNLHNQELVDESRLKLIRILNLTEEINASQGELKSKDEEGNLTENHSVVIETDDAGNTVSTWDKETVQAMSLSFRGVGQPITWNDIDDDKKRIKQWLDFEARDDLFNFGGLTKSTQLFGGSTLNGTAAEKEKYNALIELTSNLFKLDFRTKYLKTFEGLHFIPLAIQNISSVQDNNISVFVKIESGEIVEPDEKLICSEIDGCQGLVCKDEDDDRDAGMITELFAPDEDGHIHLEEAPFDPTDLQFKSSLPGYRSQKDADDYRLELQQWIAVSAGDDYYEFDIESLRPNECKWFSYGMLIRPDNGVVKIHYNISSTHSSGDIEGELCTEINQEDVRP